MSASCDVKQTLLPIAEVHERLISGCAPITATESLSLTKAHGYVLASDIIANVDVPP